MSLTPLAAPPGLNSDDTAFSSGGQWTDGNNVRFYEGKPRAIEGWAFSTSLADGTECVGIAASVVGGGFHVFYGTMGKVYSSAGSVSGSLSDITPSGAWAGASYSGYAFDNFGSTALFAPSGGTLYQWSGSGVATEVTQAPDQITDMMVTNERQVLAFGCNEEASTTFNPLCIRGSDLEDYTDWTTSATNNAFEHILDGPGSIVAARHVGQYVAVWTTAALYLGQFIGDPSQTYRFDLVDQVPGPTSREAICVIDGTAYWMGTDLQLHVWLPGAPPTVVPCPISRDFQINYDLGSGEADRMVAIPSYSEVWLFYSDQRDGATLTPSRYIAYSPRESAAARRPVWFRGRVGRTAVCASVLINDVTTKPYSWLATYGLNIFQQGEPEGEGADITGSPASITPSITLGDVYLDDGGRRTMVTRLVPDFSDQIGDISLSIDVRDHPQSTPATKGPYTIAVGAAKRDFRASGMIASFTFSSSANPCSFRIGKPVIDVVPMGQR